MAATKAWSGSLSVSGFPVHLIAYPAQRKSDSDSFKMLDPTHKQLVSQVLEDYLGNRVERASTLRGAIIGSGDDKRIVALSADQIDKINETLRSKGVPVDRFAPVDTLPLHLAKYVYYVLPDPKVDGSGKPAGIVWNGLRAGGLAFVTEWVKKDGQKPAPVAFVADDSGILAYEFPYVASTYERPQWDAREDAAAPAVDEAAATMFVTFTEATATVEPFDLTAFEDTYAARKAEVVAAAIAGTLEDPEMPELVEGAPDLMAALEASVKASKKPGKTGINSGQGSRSKPRPGGRGATRKAGAEKKGKVKA